jgi:hypothetical protein
MDVSIVWSNEGPAWRERVKVRAVDKKIVRGEGGGTLTACGAWSLVNVRL